MKIEIQVKPKSAKNKVEKLGENLYRVCVTAPPHKGEANEAVVELLADYFRVPKSSIRILLGGRGRKKLVEIE